MARLAGALTASLLVASLAAAGEGRPLCRVEIKPVEGIPAQGLLIGYANGIFTIGTRLGEFEISERDIARIAFLPNRPDESRESRAQPATNWRLTAREQSDLRSHLARLKSQGLLDGHIVELEQRVGSATDIAGAARNVIELGLAHRVSGDLPEAGYWNNLVESVDDVRLRRELRAGMWQIIRMVGQQRGRRQ